MDVQSIEIQPEAFLFKRIGRVVFRYSDRFGKISPYIDEWKGTRRHPTQEELIEIERTIEQQRRVIRELFENIGKPDFEPKLTPIYLRYVEWKNGLLPSHQPTITEQQLLAIETYRLSHSEQADSETDKKKKKRAVVPQNQEVAKLAKKIKRDISHTPKKIDIARDFTGGDEKKAKNLLRQLNRFPHLLE